MVFIVKILFIQTQLIIIFTKTFLGSKNDSKYKDISP